MKTPKIQPTKVAVLVCFVGKRSGNAAYFDRILDLSLPLNGARLQTLRQHLVTEQANQGVVLDGNNIVFTSLTRLDE